MKKVMGLLTVLFLLLGATACADNTGNEETGGDNGETGGSEGQDSNGESEADAETNSDYPEEPIEIIVPFAAGGGTDSVARVLSESLAPILDEEITVVNREGGSGANGMNEGLNAEPDGHTLTLVTREVVSLPLQGTAPFEPMDFKYVANVNEDPAVLVVSGKSDYESVDDLIKALQDNPGEMNFAASTVPNYYGIQFSENTDVEFNTVPYQGASPAITEILGGGADFGIYNPGEVKSQVESGDLRPLAVMADERFSGFEDVPTFEEEGYAIESGTYRGVAVPPETPDSIVATLEGAIQEAVETEEFQDFMEESFLGIGYYNSEEFKEMIQADEETLKPIIEIANEKAEQ
ncbi:Bug family tripartite tricarboxylate transporter substrate binding protein [Salibacterium aidingense]|uniref:Bug family tripartite tricarboxylate transporter substrate binding protein n=1 Tax=Salibacterium aidingense TaxID=384933 RepID=UPI0004249F2F|nr:tripartite tricarboxylate transporter substrate binding protein [Salibacterium aidingense]